ncbi:hypothetical protein CHLRE_08g365351v5 [Chlamydomonas reinhardtii]|uniref:Uncharacterized protein n=1 Tax=Chlamydomonas reinhardtii TaxID=3055 RepID=A0A2K3DGU3_CHLRE|nr:uncharacterized protein CHLRE_08g365351v5 [Chlamydomonas reinhardtii]PNW79755.1 hypothetical protein CHLRE_08g365351v5 [Chlamydomonas reinhardtii]
MLRSRGGAAALSAASSRHPPLPVKLSVRLGPGVSLHSGLAAALLQELIKFIQFARGQTQTPFEHLRAALQSSLESLAEQHEQEQKQEQELRASGATHARLTRPRRSRRLRLPSAVNRIIKFSESMDALLAAASPQLLAAAQPAAVAVVLGACPHRPRELYHITFSGPDGQPLLPLLQPPPSPQPLQPPRPPQPQPAAATGAVLLAPAAGSTAAASGSEAAAAAAATDAETGGWKPPMPPPPLSPPPHGQQEQQQQQQLHPPGQAVPRRGARRHQVPRSLGPDAAAALQAGLSDRERGAVRRALRGLVVAQTSVEAWSRLQRPTKMWLAVAPSAAAASTSGPAAPEAAATAAAAGAAGAAPSAAPQAYRDRSWGAAAAAAGAAGGSAKVPAPSTPPPPPPPPQGSGFRMCTRLPFTAGAACAAHGASAATATAAAARSTLPGASRALRKTLQVHIDIQASGGGSSAAGGAGCGGGAGVPGSRHGPHGGGAQGAGLAGAGGAGGGRGAAAGPVAWSTRPGAGGGGHYQAHDAEALVSLQLATSKLRLSQSPAAAAAPVASTAAGPRRSSAGGDRSYSQASDEAEGQAALLRGDGGLGPGAAAGSAAAMGTPQSKQRGGSGVAAAREVGMGAGAGACGGGAAAKGAFGAGGFDAAADARAGMDLDLNPDLGQQEAVGRLPEPVMLSRAPSVWWLCATSVRSVVKPEDQEG